ncbi:MAG: DUF1643 domain-containing protein [Pseudomonadota bacterium]
MHKLYTDGAAISDCGQYRYWLERGWDTRRGIGTVVFVGLNPSTADASQDDPTIRRCKGFAKSWGYAGLVMLNLFAYRATDPAEMKAAADPVGPECDAYIEHIMKHVHIWDVVCCWGAHGGYQDRDVEVVALLRDLKANLYHLGLTQGGNPKHPLYLRKDTPMTRWNGA